MSKSEFGKVLEEHGWARCNKSGVVCLDRYWCNDEGFNGKIMWSVYPGTYNRSQYNLFLHWLNGDQLVDITVKDEHQVLRIVAAIEGMDRWQSMESVPENEDAWYEVLVGDPEEGPHMITPAKLDGARWVDDEGELIPHQPYITAWRPYSPANWEVK